MVQASVNLNEKTVRIAPLGYLLLRSFVTYPHPQCSDEGHEIDVECNLHDLKRLKHLAMSRLSRLLAVLLHLQINVHVMLLLIRKLLC